MVNVIEAAPMSVTLGGAATRPSFTANRSAKSASAAIVKVTPTGSGPRLRKVTSSRIPSPTNRLRITSIVLSATHCRGAARPTNVAR
jgi:hypothetical protein